MHPFLYILPSFFKTRVLPTVNTPTDGKKKVFFDGCTAICICFLAETSRSRTLKRSLSSFLLCSCACACVCPCACTCAFILGLARSSHLIHSFFSQRHISIRPAAFPAYTRAHTHACMHITSYSPYIIPDLSIVYFVLPCPVLSCCALCRVFGRFRRIWCLCVALFNGLVLYIDSLVLFLPLLHFAERWMWIVCMYVWCGSSKVPSR